MPDFQADTNQLADGAARLGGVAGALGTGYGGVNPGPLGFPQAQAAMANFIAAWTAAGQTLSDGIKKLQGGLSQSAANYNSAEAANTSGSGPH